MFVKVAKGFALETADGEPLYVPEHRQTVIQGWIEDEKARLKASGVNIDDPALSIQVDLVRDKKQGLADAVTFLLSKGPFKKGAEPWGHEEQSYVSEILMAFRGVSAPPIKAGKDEWWLLSNDAYRWLVKTVKEDGAIVFRSAVAMLVRALEDCTEVQPAAETKSA